MLKAIQNVIYNFSQTFEMKKNWLKSKTVAVKVISCWIKPAAFPNLLNKIKNDQQNKKILKFQFIFSDLLDLLFI